LVKSETINCKTIILKNNQVKINCGKNHPASYRGCEAAKELQREEMKPSKIHNLEHSQTKGRELKGALWEKDETFVQQLDLYTGHRTQEKHQIFWIFL
jgi:hypothetical protein